MVRVDFLGELVVAPAKRLAWLGLDGRKTDGPAA